MTEATGPPSTSDPRRLLGHVISGRYRIEELIGEGGMGAVYRAQHTHLSKRLAVKVLHPEMLNLSEAVERFEREAIAGAHIEHPNVAAATDFGKLDDGSHFLVLEFLEGEDLRTVIGRGPIPAERAVKIVRQIALALRAAHTIGIVHRDLKPENIMLVRRERDSDVVKVLDFGIAKVPVADLTTRGSPSAAALTKLGMVYGTPEYMAPEQALGEEIDGRADLYAVGVMLYEMLSGVRPFEANSRVALLGMVATKKPPRFAERAPDANVPGPLEEIAMRLLEKTAADRYASADELLEAVDIAILELDYSMAAPRGSRVELSPPLPRVRGGGVPDAPAPAVTYSAAERGATSSGRAALVPGDGGGAVVRRRPGVPLGRRALGSVLLAAGGLVVTVVIVVIAVVMRDGGALSRLEQTAPGPAGGSAEPVPRDPSPSFFGSDTASESELTTARTQGLAALGTLAQKYPKDPAVLRALLFAHARDPSGYAAAVGVAKRLLELSPKSVDDEDLQRLLVAATAGPSEAVGPALDLLGNSMGSKGPDLLYQIMMSSSKGKDRAAKVLGDPQVQGHATPALRIAYELQMATSCKSKKPLLDRAGSDGDERSAAILRPLIVAKSRGCGMFGLGGCPAPCSTIAGDIQRALSGIDARARK